MIRHLAWVAATVLATSAAAAELPVRKAGLWDLKVTIEGGRVPPQTIQHCTDPATDKAMTASFGGAQSEMCSKQDVQNVGNTLVVESVCKMGAMTMTSRAVITGDFNSAYTVKVTSKRAGGPPGMPEETSLTIDAKWTGACKPGQEPGDIILGNGMKMNVRDMGKMRPGMPTPQ